jgi:heat shock protein HslJ
MIRSIPAAAALAVAALLLAAGCAVTAPADPAAGRAADAAPRASSSDRTLENTYWKLVELGGAKALAFEREREAHVILQREPGRVVGSGGCNRLTGTYVLDGASLTFSRVAATMMACAQGMEQERAFLDALGAARIWRVAGDALELADASGAVLARFVAVDLE